MSSGQQSALHGDQNQPVTARNVDLSNCDRELVQYSGAVQPHSALLTLKPGTLEILQVSANTGALFGIEAAGLPGRLLQELFGAEQTEQVRLHLERETLVNVPPVHLQRVTLADRSVHVFAHEIDNVIVLELEPVSQNPPALDIYSKVRGAIARLQTVQGLTAFFDKAVTEIREITGFERVMTYQFLADGSGHVTAEALADGLEPMLGLHYPASDIPQPARRLFSMAWLRHLPDVEYTPVPLVPDLNPVSNAPLDLSYVAGRHLSVMYTKYLQNMGVKSTMVMTLLKNGELWGLISCMNHSSPMHVPYESRIACEFLANMVSLLMAAKEDASIYEQRLRTDAILDRVLEVASRGSLRVRGSLYDSLTAAAPSLLTALNAGGVAVVSGESIAVEGNTPEEKQILALTEWLMQQPASVFSTDNLSQQYPPAADYAELASGLLAVRISRSGSECVLWFRPEMLTTVHWAGDPHKPVEVVVDDIETRLQPRTSFAKWTQEVKGRSAPWQAFEVEAVRGLRQSLIELVVSRAVELERINRQLEQSNIELDSFAYVASHDLKEPLRGIHNYSNLLQRSASERLSESERSRLDTVLRLTQRMDDLIESLLQYSRVGRTDLILKPVNLNEVVGRALELLRSRIDQPGVRIEVHELRVAICDRIRLREVFYNLILNALKYNDREEKVVEVGFVPGDPTAYYVRDNGIGISPEYHDEIFRIFKRLHGRDEYGGGTGAGLTIARKTVERHGGRLWVESTPGVGSTFYFTLAAATAAAASGGHE